VGTTLRGSRYEVKVENKVEGADDDEEGDGIEDTDQRCRSTIYD